MSRLVTLFAISLVLGAPLAAQEFEDTPGWYPPEWPKPAKEISDAEAKPLVKAFTTAMKAAKEQKAKLKAVESLRTAGVNKQFVSPLCKALLKEKDFQVRRKLVQTIGLLGNSKAESTLIKVIVDSKNRDELELLLDAGLALGKCAKKSNFRKLRKEFNKGSPHVKRAMVVAWGAAKDWKAIGHLGSWVDKPEPANANSPSNPPASYWQAKHKEWRQIQRQVEWALWSITEKVFYSGDEVRKFLKANPRPPKKKRKGAGK